MYMFDYLDSANRERILEKKKRIYGYLQITLRSRVTKKRQLQQNTDGALQTKRTKTRT